MNGREWYRIGDAARELDVETHVIRYWETEFKLFLRPNRTATAQRWYTPEHIAALREVQRLLHIELYTIAGAKRQLRLAVERAKAAG